MGNGCFNRALTLCAAIFFAVSTAYAGEKSLAYDDQYIRIETSTALKSRGELSLEIGLIPKPGWKLLVDNSSGGKPLSFRFHPGKCLKLKGNAMIPKPDLAGYDESGAYSEYFTKETAIRQDFRILACGNNGTEGVMAVSYLLCQESRCVGPFSRELRFSYP